MKLDFRTPGHPTKLLGAGGYCLDHDDGGNMAYTGLWHNGKVIGLVIARNEDIVNDDYLYDYGDEIVGRFNAFNTLVQALVVAEQALTRSVNAVSKAEQDEAIAAVRSALRFASES